MIREAILAPMLDLSSTISKGAIGTPAWPSGILLIATKYWDSLDTVKAGLASPQGQAAVGDLANFADRGAELYFFDT